ncbi:hypothetical protein [Neosynechococcus sphagnicola]|uniref:hypothetical protein n=1 Tax=Neosynechococcus sphagnicola TaxID=1501145 RepID=UPI0006909B0B|nr:hypothetical protein [Neosynechococcus sphagnicola]
MDFQGFLNGLADLYEDWGELQTTPRSPIFSEISAQIQDGSDPKVLQLLNWAVSNLEDNEVYCQLGCQLGSNLIGALSGHPEALAYAVETCLDAVGKEDRLEQLISNLESYRLTEQGFFLSSRF